MESTLSEFGWAKSMPDVPSAPGGHVSSFVDSIRKKNYCDFLGRLGPGANQKDGNLTFAHDTDPKQEMRMCNFLSPGLQNERKCL
jgi:hypothetical protein